MTDTERDIEEIRRIHREWWASNKGLDVERMSACFAPDYLMWNLNGHPYYSLAEKEHLFRYYQQHMVPTDPPVLWDVRVHVDHDTPISLPRGSCPSPSAPRRGRAHR